MKKIFVAVLAMAGVVACNTVDTLDVPQNPEIRFANAFVENATRANEALDPSTTTESLTAFDVWGFMDEPSGVVFEGEDVTGSKGNFSYTNTQYWAPGHTYYFAALAPMNSANWSLNTDTAGTTGAGVVTFTNVNGTEDLLYSAVSVAAPASITAAPETVKFTFSHLLSKVKFTFVNGFTNDNATIDIKNIHITNAPAKASANLVGEWWTANPWTLEGTETVDLAFGDACEKLAMGAKQECANERLTIPAAQDIVVTFDVALYMGTVKAYSGSLKVTVKDIALELGKAYNFTATLNASNITKDGQELYPIVFDVEEVKDWVVAGTPDAQVKDAELRAAAQFGGKLTLSEDIALQSTLVVTSDLVLNLGGHTLTNKLENAATDVIVVAEGATLTIEGNGTVEAVTGNDGYAVIAEGTVIINGGTFKSGVDANREPNAVVYARGNGEVYVNGGYFPNDNESKFVLNKKDADRETTVIEVKGGEFGCFNPANNAAENAGTNFVAEGYAVAINAAGNYVVLPFYGEVALTEDVKLTSTLSVTKDLTLDLNGHNLTIANDSTELGEGDGIIVTAGTLTIKGEGTVTANTRAIWARGNGGAVINIEGGHYVGATKGNTGEVIYASGNGKINIYGGTFEAETEDNVSFAAPQYAVLNLHGNGATGCDIVVYGGSFKNFNPADNISENPKHNFCAEGYHAVEANGVYHVVAAGINAVAGDTVKVMPGTYGKFPSVGNKEITLLCDGAVFVGSSKFNIGGSTVEGATFQCDWQNSSYDVVNSSAINAVFKNCVFNSWNAIRYGYAGETCVFEDCEIKGGSYGIHFDGGANDVIFRRCKISGFNAFAAAVTMLTFEDCQFVHATDGLWESDYNGANLWGSAKMVNCEFTFDGSSKQEWIDCIGADKSYEFTNCTVNGEDFNASNYASFSQISSRNHVTVKINGLDCTL